MLVASSIFLTWTATLSFFIDNISATESTSTSLESVGIRDLSPAIPNCADSCVRSFIQSSFPSTICGNQGDLGCLCTTSGLGGFTLGEGVLQCVVSNCPSAESNQYRQAYTICSGIPGALQPTHATLTAFTRISSTVVIPTGTTSISTTTATSSLPTTTLSTSIRSSQTSRIQTRSSTTSQSSTSASAASVTSTSTPSSPILTRPQIIGISVSLGILGLIAMTLLTYICCFRGRAKRESSLSFGSSQPLMNSINGQRVYTTSPGLPHVYPYVPSKAQSVLGQKYPAWTPSSEHGYIPIFNGGSATSPRYDTQQTPGSAATYQSTSKLLPDKPTYPIPLRPQRDGTEGVLLAVPGTGRTRHYPPNLKASPDSFNSGPIIRKQPSDPFLQAPEAVHKINQRASRQQLPRLETKSQYNSYSASRENVQQPTTTYDPATYGVNMAPNWKSTGTRPIDPATPGIAVTTNTAVPARSSSKAYRPAHPPKGVSVFDKYKPIAPAKQRPAASTVTSFESGDEDDGPLPPMPNIRNPSPTASQKTTWLDYSNNGSSLPKEPLPTSTPLLQLRYPAVPSITSSPTSQPISAANTHPSHPTHRKLQHQHQQHRQSGSPHTVSPLSAEVRRKDGFILPRLERLSNSMDLSQVSRDAIPLTQFITNPAELGTILENRGHQEKSSWERITPTNPLHVIPPQSSPQAIERLFSRGYAELPEYGSSIRSISDHGDSREALAMQRYLSPIPAAVYELPSPDAERLDPLAAAGTRLVAGIGQKDSRGARLGAAIANKSPVACRTVTRGEQQNSVASTAQIRTQGQNRTAVHSQHRARGASTSQVHVQTHSPLRAQHSRTRSDAVGMRIATARAGTPAVTGFPPLRGTTNTHLTGPASKSQRHDSPDVNSDIRGTAKWTVLCGPGQN